MGQKGDKNTGEAQLSVQLLIEKLKVFAGITSKKMFGGYGIFHDRKMFGMVDSQGQAYLKLGETSRKKFEDEGAQPNKKMPYHSIPNNIIHSDELLIWVHKSITASKN